MAKELYSRSVCVCVGGGGYTVSQCVVVGIFSRCGIRILQRLRNFRPVNVGANTAICVKLKHAYENELKLTCLRSKANKI